MEVKVKLLSKTAQLPTRGSAYAAGYDLRADVMSMSNGGTPIKNIRIPRGATVVIPTGIAMEIPSGYFGAIYPRSGLATKQGLRLANCTAVIDEDYRGEVKVALFNDSDSDRIIEHGDRIAQMVIQPYLSVEWTLADELEDTERGSGGFGSTGIG